MADKYIEIVKFILKFLLGFVMFIGIVCGFGIIFDKTYLQSDIKVYFAGVMLFFVLYLIEFYQTLLLL